MPVQHLMISLVGAIIWSTALCESPDWDSRTDAKLLKYNNQTNQIEDSTTPVWQRCKCDFSNCDCFVEYLTWNNGSFEARLYFRVDPNVPKKTFTATFYDNRKDLSTTFPLDDGITCKSFKNGLIDKFCVKVYGRASYLASTRVCLQVGVIIKRDDVVSSDVECIKAWSEGTTHSQPSTYENPNLSDLNNHLYKLRYSSSGVIAQPVFIMPACILWTLVLYLIFN